MTQTDVVPLEIQLALSRVAVGIQSELYRGCKLAGYEPRRKTVVHDAWHGKKLSERHQKAWKETLMLFERAAGVSPRNGGYGERRGGGERPTKPVARSNRAQASLELLYGQHLHHHEWRLLHSLVLEHFQGVKVFTLQQLGRLRDGYNDEAQARAAGITNLHRLFDSLAEFHGM